MNPRQLIRIGTVAAVLACLSFGSSFAISFGQIDDFEDGTAQGWDEGNPSPNPPVNIASGGPAGAGDHYLQNVSSGGFGPGSRMIMFNQAQWSGDYVAAGVSRIVMWVANFGAADLYVRVAFQGGSTIYASTNAHVIPPGGVWQQVTFELTTTELTLFSGSQSLATALANVTEMRILSAAAGPTWYGDNVAGTMGVDGVEASSSTVATEPSTWGAVKALYE